MEYIGDWNHWQVYKNSDGFFEGYKSVGKKINICKDQNDKQVSVRSNSKRVVTTAKNMTEFIKQIENATPKKKTLIKTEPINLFDESNNPL